MINNPFGFVAPEYREILNRYTAFAPSNIDGIIEKLGLFVIDQKNLKASLHHNFTDGQKYMLVPEEMLESRKRYFVAKGIAAWMLKDRPNVSNETLIAIATEIIMPTRLIQEYCAINNCDPKYNKTIAKHFKVTIEALQLRLKQLGYSWEEEHEPA